jgi:hypothetical protein
MMLDPDMLRAATAGLKVNDRRPHLQCRRSGRRGRDAMPEHAAGWQRDVGL